MSVIITLNIIEINFFAFFWFVVAVAGTEVIVTMYVAGGGKVVFQT